MNELRNGFNSFLEAINSFLWADIVLYGILATGILFLFWTKGSPFLALTHGFQVLRGQVRSPERSWRYQSFSSSVGGP